MGCAGSVQTGPPPATTATDIPAPDKPKEATATPVSEATATPSAPSSLKQPAARAQAQDGRPVLEEVQAFEAEPSAPSDIKMTPRNGGRGGGLPALPAVTAPPPKSQLPPLKAEVDTSEVDRLLNMNSGARAKGQPVLLGEEELTAVQPMQQQQRQNGGALPPLAGPSPGGPTQTTQVEGFSSQPDDGLRGGGAEPGEGGAKENEAPAEEEDPWASLQSAYKIGQKGSAASGARSARPSARKAAKGADDEDDEDEVVVLDEGRNSSGTSAVNGGGSGARGELRASLGGNRARQGQQQQAPRGSHGAAGGQPRAGGWGDGDLAAAGTLMLDDDPPAARPMSGRGHPTPPGAVQHSGPSYNPHDEDDDMPLEAGGMVGASHGAGDLGMEDVEDVDALIEAEMANNGMNADLAAKLRKFEAMNDDDVW